MGAGLGLLAVPVLYAGVMGWLRGGWQRNVLAAYSEPETTATAEAAVAPGAAPLFSILIAARNEAENLPQLLLDLGAQILPAAQFEVLLADDHSTDATVALVAQAAQHTHFVLRLISLPPAQTGKKAALLAALAAAPPPPGWYAPMPTAAWDPAGSAPTLACWRVRRKPISSAGRCCSRARLRFCTHSSGWSLRA
ncbi:hypothetical protein BEN47_07420 [Hymenobacter lapidarius]|uniref:Glycosyltransferase 2-like domain-containing protein n=1 Tax=Hymenobacter lapidarius TaxID=1908237 RepID=A0A1G1TEB5_9BACT|nr:hypothetical protein BEN47_07420 [Hymenobacter lapidarius]